MSLIEVYGSLLNSAERYLIEREGRFREIGKEPRVGWMLSFDKRSIHRHEGVLNFVQTNRGIDQYYTTVFEADEAAYDNLLEREMGLTNAERLRRGQSIPSSCYRPIRLTSSLGETELFVIPPEGRKPCPTSWNANYVRIVKTGIEESYRGRMKETNLRALRAAVNRSRAR